MMNSVKEIIYTVGDSTGAFARSLGLRTAELSRSVGSGTVRVAKDVRSGTVRMARDIGPKRGLIGAAILAAAIGGSVILVRYLRRRDQERYDEESMMGEEGMEGRRGMSRAERRAVNTANANMR